MTHIDKDMIKVGDNLLFLGLRDTPGGPLEASEWSGKIGVVNHIKSYGYWPLSLNIEGTLFDLSYDEVAFVKAKPIGEWL